MTIQLDQLADAGEWLQRGRGGFLSDRSGYGAPHVADPTGATVNHPGLKGDLLKLCAERGIDVPDKATVADLHQLLGPKGPKRLKYGSPSSFGDLIEDPEAVVQYEARCGIKGMGIAIDGLQPVADEVKDARDKDLDDIDYKKDARRIWATLQEIGGGNVSSDRGTLIHAAICCAWQGIDWRDDGPECLNDDGVLLITKAAELDLTVEVVNACIAVFVELINDAGLEILAMEAPCVNDAYRQAGTLDCLARATKDLTIGDAQIPAGTVVVVDIKTGKMRT